MSNERTWAYKKLHTTPKNRKAYVGKIGQYSQRFRAGFTLMELLVVIAILAVILVIAGPSLAQIARNSEINRLDNYAKELYVAVQDQFITMEASGEYAGFNAAVLQTRQDRNLGSLGAMPHDALGSDWVEYYYLQGGAASSFAENDADLALAEVVARTSVLDGLTKGGRYIFEINPRADGTDVYAVFYSEDPDFSFADVQNLASRNRPDRMNTGSGYPVGYYCGITTASSELPDHFSPYATFVNGEELFLKVACPGSLALVSNERDMEMRIVLDCDGESQTLVLTGGQDFHLDAAGNIDIDIVFDSMREGFHLADLFPTFSPGADIEATVEVLYNGNGVVISTPANMQAKAKDNSLFAKNNSGDIEVANVRHINNLRLIGNDARSVIQVAPVDFDAMYWGSSEVSELSSASKDYNLDTYSTEYVNPLDPRVVDGASGFMPLETAGVAWSYDGNSNQLNDFYIAGSAETGLFATIQSAQAVRNTILVDPQVYGGGPCGALCGELQGSIENCGVRLEVREASALDKVSTHTVSSDASDAVGGLVGLATGSANIARSFAAIDVVAPSAISVGGLVGSFASQGSISQSYASGEVTGADIVGGLVGSFDGGSIADCYSTSDINTSGYCGGIAGQASAGSITNTMAYGRVNSDLGGGFTGGEGASFSNCAFLQDVGYNSFLMPQPAGIEAKSYGDLADMRLAADHSFPYRESLMGSAFPFANVLEEHWGNWPSSLSFKPMLVYYELYADGDYGFYGTQETPDGPVIINTLDGENGGIVIVEDGYALLSTYAIRGFEYSLNGGEKQRLTRANVPQAGSFVELNVDSLYYWNGSETLTLDDFFVYQLPFELQMLSRTATSFADLLELSFADAAGSTAETYSYYYNPDFAMLVSNPGADGSLDAPDTSSLYVRTPRHLNRLAVQSAYWASNAHIIQAYDIDSGEGYYTSNYLGDTLDFKSGTYAMQPIASKTEPFMGSYDGHNHTIIDFFISANGRDDVGLFGSVMGTVSNVHLVGSQLNEASVVHYGQTSGGTLAAGALVGWLDGTVEGCSASGLSVYAGSAYIDDASVGGLVGVNVGSIERSSAANVDVSVVSTCTSAANLGLGGLTGSNGGSINSCYAVEINLFGQALGAGSGRQLLQGGIAGYGFGGGSIAHCYAYAFAEGNTIATENDIVEHFDITNPDDNTLNNCYRLSWDDGSGGGFTTGAMDDDRVISCTPDELKSASLGAAFAYGGDVPVYGNAYFYDVRLVPGHLIQSDYRYPYPAVCTNNDGEFVHYGFDWWE
ncbi:MAG: prepilin-type N-terminal cleavage/methylation domain-containing protein [Eggerthellaceae bacterium]|nr:prepilin-type N-terminal cleavage/methylation domain-containing protein [Eggerthellaceae bacterium]